MYKIIFLDIDGTLINDDKIIPEKNKEAVQKLKQMGLTVVLATGRPTYHFKSISEELGIESFVSFNGAYVSYKGHVIKLESIEKKHVKKLIDLSSENNHPLVFSNHEKTVCNALDDPNIIETFNYLKVHYIPDYHPDFWKENELLQIMLYCKENEEDQYRESIPELSFVRWHPYSLDVMPVNLSKATGIKAMLNFLGISPDESIAFGDGLNDKEMLEFVGMGIAMGNAHELLKPYAKMVTKSVDEGGISYALCQLGLL